MKKITLEQLIEVYAFSMNDVPEQADAIIYLEGDSFHRVERCVELWCAGYAPLIVISGTDDRPHLGCYKATVVEERMLQMGVPKTSIHLEDCSINTRDQAVEIMKLARKHKWKKIILVTSLYHQPRAYLTFVGTMREMNMRIKIISLPTQALPWFMATPRGTRLNIIRGEVKKINMYLEKGHLASFRIILEYQKWKEKTP